MKDNSMKHSSSKGIAVTLKDIAERLKVSKVTVSKALRGHLDISAETAKKINKVAREMGYSPNFWARNLSSNRSNAVGVVLPKIAHHFFGSVTEGIYEAAFEHNYEVILMISQENPERELKHVNTLLSMRVDGLLISLTQQTRDYEVFKTLQNRGVIVTFMDRVPKLDGFNMVVADDHKGAHAATSHAISIGYRKIAHLAGFQHTNIGRERYQGYRDAMDENHVKIRKNWVVYGGFGEDDGYKGFMKLYESGEMPECVFAVAFPVAFGMYKAAGELRIRIPEDIDILCFGNSGINQFLSPPMSYVDQPTHELGRKAFELTVESIRQKGRFPPQFVKLPTHLVLCKTCTKKVAVPKKAKGS